jgi:hypothetical protein
VPGLLERIILFNIQGYLEVLQDFYNSVDKP